MFQSSGVVLSLSLMSFFGSKQKGPSDPTIGAAEKLDGGDTEDEEYEAAETIPLNLMERLTAALERLGETRQVVGTASAGLVRGEEGTLTAAPSASVLFNLQSLLGTFPYKPDSEHTFNNWFFRNKPIL